MFNPKEFVMQDKATKCDNETAQNIVEFYINIETLEKKLSNPIVILKDKKTDVFYIECHMSTQEFVKFKDEDATLDPDFQEEYRLNRALQPDNQDFLEMKHDAKSGRQFSDIVVEYNKSYKGEKPLKILGGQHRTKAIEDSSPKDSAHGLRIYFNLNKEKRAEIAKVSNTNIAISGDLLDRLDEQSLEPPNKLRNFAHKIGILDQHKDFADRKASVENLPTVRLMRAFIVNFYKGKQFKGDFDVIPMESYLCDLGGSDPEYKKIFNKVIDFTKEDDLVEAGINFVKLHKKQFAIASQQADLKRKKEYRNKAWALAVVSSWSLVSGLLQKKEPRLKKFYSLPDLSKKSDPLNVIEMSKFKFSPYDIETYRGIGARTDDKERGRLTKIFLEYSKDGSGDKIDAALLNKAVKLYHAAKLTDSANKA